LLLSRRRAAVSQLGDVQEVLAGALTEQARRCGKPARLLPPRLHLRPLRRPGRAWFPGSLRAVTDAPPLEVPRDALIREQAQRIAMFTRDAQLTDIVATH
jgi:hypothetical protein